MLLALLALASPAAADVPDDIPGTAGDPIVSFSLLPPIVDAPLVPGIAVRGADPANTKVLFDEFELPFVFQADRGVRSNVLGAAYSNITAARDGVEYGGGTTFVSLDPVTFAKRPIVEITDNDAAVSAAGFPVNFVSARCGDLLDNQLRCAGNAGLQYRTTRWLNTLTYITGFDDGLDSDYWARLVARLTYRTGPWRSSFAVSPAVFRDYSLDARYELEHSAPAAGLRRVTWRSGIDSTNARHNLDSIFWTNDLGAWSKVTAVLSPNIVATAGLRIDAFVRGHDVATQPRGSIEGTFDKTSVKLEAGAYRRPPELLAELPFEYLHPERTTQVTASVDHGRDLGNHRVVAGQLLGFYIDRTRLVARDSTGDWGNSGTGTSQGVELSAFVMANPWMGYVGASVSSAVRRDFARGRERSTDFDQPVRIDALVRYTKKRWRIAARFSLSSGLPYTPVVETTFNADADSYVPVYGFTNSARLPWMHSLDLRADVRLSKSWSAFAELRNAYAANTALGYQYSYDYKQRLDVTLPILPYIGLRADLPVPPRYPPARPMPVIAEAAP